MAEVQVLYVATAKGVVQLVNPGTSRRWRPVGDALAGEDARAVRASALDPLQVYTGTQSGLYATRDGGASWELELAGSVTALATAEDGAMYAGTDAGTILRGGMGDWSEVHAGKPLVVQLNELPNGRIAAVYQDGSVEALEGGAWRPAHVSVPCVGAIVGSAADRDGLISATETGIVTSSGARTVPDAPAQALLLLMGKPPVLLIGTRGAIQRSEDEGATLAAVEGPRNARALVSPPRFQDYAYAGTGAGELWASTDRGRTWNKLHEGMAAVRDLAFARVR